jgi:hypothetical protein
MEVVPGGLPSRSCAPAAFAPKDQRTGLCRDSTPLLEPAKPTRAGAAMQDVQGWTGPADRGRYVHEVAARVGALAPRLGIHLPMHADTHLRNGRPVPYTSGLPTHLGTAPNGRRRRLKYGQPGGYQQHRVQRHSHYSRGPVATFQDGRPGRVADGAAFRGY